MNIKLVSIFLVLVGGNQMSEFQNLFKDMIKDSENTIYALSTMTGIERSYLSKIISGKRKMTFDIFLSIIDAVCESESETKRKEIVEAYINDVFGRDKFENYYYHLTSDIADYTNSNQSTISEITYDFKTFDSKLSLYNFALFFLSDNNKTNRIYTNVPVRTLLDIACKKENCDFRCIINANNKDKNVSIFDLIKLNIICCTGYIDENTASIKNKSEFYPYIIISDNSILFSSRNFDRGYYISNSELADLYANEFCNTCKYLKVNSQIHDDVLNVKEPIAKYLFNREVHRVMTSNLCVVPFMTRHDWEELAQPDLADRGYLINTTYEYYQEFFNSISCHMFIAPISGLVDFCDNGTVKEMPTEYSKPLSVETRIALLEKIVHYIKEEPDKYKLNFLRNNNLVSEEITLSIESSFDHNADYETTLITMSDDKAQKTHFPGNYLFLSTDKDAITEYNSFFDILRISDKVMTKEETLAALEDRILRLKYNAENINTAIDN